MQKLFCIALCALLLPLSALSKKNPFSLSAAPDNFTASAGDTKIVLTWSAPVNNGGLIVTGFKLYRGTIKGGGKNLIKTFTANVFTVTDESKVNGTTYYYVIKAVNADGDGTASAEISAVPGSTPPKDTITKTIPIDSSGLGSKPPAAPPASSVPIEPPTNDSSTQPVTAPIDTLQQPTTDSTVAPAPAPEIDNGDYSTTFTIVSGTSNPWDTTATAQQAYMYTPPGYNNGNKRKYPVIIFLHGTGELGRNQIKNLTSEGLPLLLNQGMKPDSCLIFCPQLNYSSWTKAKIEASLNWIIANYRIDTNRVYVTGLSLGANGTFEALKGMGNRIAAAISSNGFNNGPATLPAASYSMLWDVPVMFIGGDKDGTIPFDYTTKTTIPVVTSVASANARKDPMLIPMELLCIKGGTHSRNVWNDNCYDISKAPFNFINWFLQFSKNKTYTANKQVELLEKYVTLKKNDQALFKYRTAVTYVKQLPEGTEKTNLNQRIAAAYDQLNNAGKRFIIKFGNNGTDGSYNYLATGATGQAVKGLKDMAAQQTSGYTFTINKQASSSTYFTTDNSTFNHSYMGLTQGFLQNGFVASGDGGDYEFSGLDNSKTYRLVAFGAYNHTTPSAPAELTVIVDSTAKTLFTNTTSVNWIEFSNLTPANGKLTFKVKGSPSYINANSVTKTETGATQTALNNVVGFNYDAYINGVMLVENTLTTNNQRMAMPQQKALPAPLPLNKEKETLKTAIFPNPVSDGLLHIQLASSMNGQAEVLIYNLEGKLIRMESFQTIAKGNTLNLHVNNLPKGMYLLKIQANSSYTTHKVLVQ